MRLVTDYKMSFDGAAALAADLLNLPGLAGTTVMRWFRRTGEQLDGRTHLLNATAVFSGQIAVDEIYDAPFWVIRVTDPVNKIELITSMGHGSPTADDVADIFCDLRDAGIKPKLVVTDESSLYPAIIAEIFPEAEHQLCVFHFIKGVNEALGATFRGLVAAMPKPKKRKRGRPKKRGRPREDGRKAANIKRVRACRYLVFQRHLTDAQREQLDATAAVCPGLAELRRFIEAFHAIFVKDQSAEEAEKARQSLMNDDQFKQSPAFAGTIKKLTNNGHFRRLTHSLKYVNADRTSNHAERENREFRKRQLSHYCLRTDRSMKAFLLVMTTRRAVPTTPRRLVRREPPDVTAQEKEVGATA